MSRRSFRGSDPEPLAHSLGSMCVFLLLWPQLLPGSSGMEGLNFQLPPLMPPQRPPPQSLLTSLVREKEVCLWGVGRELGTPPVPD